jgi:beta-galactosidase/beta-glucuronidase
MRWLQGHPNGKSRLKVKFPKSLKNKNIQLYFGAADESAKVFVNEKLSGQFDIGPSGWDKPFFIDATDQVVPGKENLLAVRVVDTNERRRTVETGQDSYLQMSRHAQSP